MPDDAIDICSEAHQRDPRNANILRDRAEAFILNQEYEKGTGGPSPRLKVTELDFVIWQDM